jgi:hypothetical protein
MSFKGEIRAFIAAYSRSKEPWFLDELQTSLETIDNDLVMAPPTNSALHNFANLGTFSSRPFTKRRPRTW